MDEDTNVEVVAVEEFGVVHQLGRNLFSGAVGFGAAKIADRLYDGAIRTIRARRSK